MSKGSEADTAQPNQVVTCSSDKADSQQDDNVSCSAGGLPHNWALVRVIKSKNIAISITNDKTLGDILIYARYEMLLVPVCFLSDTFVRMTLWSLTKVL